MQHESKPSLLAVALVSAATLAVQVLQTRLFGVMLWHHLTYMVVTVTLLGFGAAGSLLALFPRLARLGGDPRAAVSICCSLFALTLVGAFALVARTPLETIDIERERAKYMLMFVHHAYLVVPFLCSGLAVAIALGSWVQSVHRTYLWNLVGSGLGSVLFVLTIRPLGGPGALLLCASLGGLAALCATTGLRSGGAWPARLLGLVALSVWPASLMAPSLVDRVLPIRPAPSKAQDVFEDLYSAVVAATKDADPSYPDLDPKQRRTIWTPLCRLDTMEMPRDAAAAARDRSDPASGPRTQVHVFQDGDAPTVIWSAAYARELAYDSWMYGLGYRLVERPRVLIIGSGGGNDIETALHYGAVDVTAVEINGATLGLVRDELGPFTNHVYTRDKVHAVHAEGRSFLRRTGGTYDLLQMSGTDTYAALSSGSYIFSESYLYTEEALGDYLERLSERGVITIIRPRFDPPRETLKLVATAARAMRRFGIGDARGNFIVVNHEDSQHLTLADTFAKSAKTELAAIGKRLLHNFGEPTRFDVAMMRKVPFTAEEVARIEKALEPMNAPSVKHWLAYSAGHKAEPDSAYARLLAAMAEGERAEAEFHRTYPYNTQPATDDRPFFFNFFTWRDFLGSRAERPRNDSHTALVGGEPIGIYILLSLLVQTIVATAVLVLLPLLRIRRAAGGRTAGGMRILLYFTALGLAYLLVEITTIQRFVLYLGHPTYSLTVGLAGFLVFSGLGSGWAGRAGLGPRAAVVAAVVVAALLVAHALFLPGFLLATLAQSEPVRVLLTLLAIGPLAFAMGIPFPTGLKQLRDAASGVVPWAVGMNGAASVVASVVSIILAMEFGFAAVSLVAAGLYLLAALAFPSARAANAS